MSSAASHDLRTYDPLQDKSYAATRLGRSVVDFLAWMELGGAADMAMIEAKEAR